MDSLLYLIWNVDPEIFSFGERSIRWYGLLFASGFLIGQQIMVRIFKKEVSKDEKHQNQAEKDVETLTVYLVVATIIGARLGHVIFYEPDKYLANPIDILKIWEGGLASHGGAIGILIAIWIYANYNINNKWFFIIPIKLTVKKEKKPSPRLPLSNSSASSIRMILFSSSTKLQQA